MGGVSILGGAGTVVGALLGAILIDTLELSLLRVPEVSEFWRDAILGGLILARSHDRLHRRPTAPQAVVLRARGRPTPGAPPISGVRA